MQHSIWQHSMHRKEMSLNRWITTSSISMEQERKKLIRKIGNLLIELESHLGLPKLMLILVRKTKNNLKLDILWEGVS